MPALLIAAALMGAAPATPPPPSPPSDASQGACTSEPFHQFDFLLGDWTVSATGASDPLSKLTVTRAADGCALLEQATPVKGVGSVSLMAYDADATLWRVDQISGIGEILDLQGGLQDGKMVMEGDRSGGGKHMLVRLTWISNGESVHESAEQSTDGRVWDTWFDRDFRRPAATPPAAASPAAPAPATTPGPKTS